MSNQVCSVCGAAVSPCDGVSVGYQTGTKFMCSRCYNESVAEHLGLDYEHVTFDPLTIQDLDGVPHTFNFRTHIFSDRLSLEALETGPKDGYEFAVIAAAEQDLFITFKTLFERIRRELGRRHIEPQGRGYRITHDDVLPFSRPDTTQQRTAVAFLLHIHYPGAQAPGNIPGLVGAAVIRDQHFPVDLVLFQEGQGLSDTKADGFFLVQARHQDGQFCFFCHRECSSFISSRSHKRQNQGYWLANRNKGSRISHITRD